MTGKTAPAKKGRGGAKKGKNTKKAQSVVERDGGLERLYARVTPEVKALIDQAAADDERSTMKYLERLINQHAEKLKKKAS